MKLTCSSCNKTLNVPEDKLPDARRFSVTCPSCNAKITVDRDQQAGGGKGFAGAPKAGDRKPIEPEIFPPGSKIAFVFVQNQDWKSAVEKELKSKDYYISTASDQSEGALKMEINQYDVIVLEDLPENEPLLDEINSWSGIKRRDMNVILIGGKAFSMDPNESFYRGVNSYINQKDLQKAGDLLSQCIKAYDIHYELLTLAMSESQKEV